MTKIVFIDSVNGARELYSQLLDAAGYRVYQATTAQYGLWLCAQCSPDLIITTRDPVDAEIEGDDFVAALRERSGRTPVLVVSHRNGVGGYAEESDSHRYLELMNEIHRVLDDGIAELAATGGRTAEGAASSTRP
jgi:DNA-binding NtrC family response regulator